MNTVLFIFAITLFSCLCKQPKLFLLDKELSRILRAPIETEKEHIIDKFKDYMLLLNMTIEDFKNNIEEADILAINMYIYGIPKFLKYKPNLEDIKLLWNWDRNDMEIFDLKLNESRLLWNKFIQTYRMIKKLDEL